MVFVATSVGGLGFLVTSVLVLVCVPLGLFTTVQTLWSLHAIGHTRKTLSTLLIFFLWWTLPLLAILLLAWSWAIVGILLETALWILPPVLVYLACYFGIKGAYMLRQVEREKPQTVDDISLTELSFVLLMAITSFCTTGWALLLLTLTKSPVLFAGIMYHGSIRALHHINAAREQIGAWVLLLLIGFCVGFWLAVPCVGLVIVLSLLAEVVVATLWPPFVAHYGMPGEEHPELFSVKSLTYACKAAYQVVWLSDLVQNAAIRGRTDILVELVEQCSAIRSGSRLDLSPEIQAFSLLPHIPYIRSKMALAPVPVLPAAPPARRGWALFR